MMVLGGYIPFPKTKMTMENQPFSGVNLLLVSMRVIPRNMGEISPLKLRVSHVFLSTGLASWNPGAIFPQDTSHDLQVVSYHGDRKRPSPKCLINGGY